MRRQERNVILWLGVTAPEGWASTAGELQLDLRQASSLPDEVPTSWRNVVIQVETLRRSSLRSLLTACLPIMDAGVGVILLTRGSDSTVFAPVDRLMEEFRREHGLVIGPHSSLMRVHLPANSCLPLLSKCIAHDPGTPPSDQLVVDGGANIHASDFIFMKRIFGRYNRITLTRKSGGRSTGGAVWRVDAVDSNGHATVPFIVKCGPRSAIEQERLLHDDFVRPFIEFSHQPARVASGWVRGASRAALAATLVPDAVQLDEHLIAQGDGPKAIATLFDCLRPWRGRGQGQLHLVSPGGEYVQESRDAQQQEPSRINGRIYEVLPSPQELEPTFSRCRSTSSGLPKPKALWRLLERQPRGNHRYCKVHGDLNSRNVLVRKSGSIVLLDFSHCNRKLASRDPARLETNIAFDVGSRAEGFLPEAALDALYSDPLLASSLPEAQDQRIMAIREIRRQCGEEGIQEPDYAISVACHLLRFSRHREDQTTTAAGLTMVEEDERLRARAYLIASRLIEAHCGSSAP